MAKFYPSSGGGGGVSSDELTSTAEYVLQDMTYVGKDTNDEIGTGSMINYGAVSKSLNCGESYEIPTGYHKSGKVTANSLASQTSATATAAKILSGYTAYVNGVLVTGIVVVNSLTSFSVAVSSGRNVVLTWTVPTAATGKPFSGIHVRYKTGSAPTSISDGTAIYTGNNNVSSGSTSVTVSLPALSTTYYFSAWAYATIDNAKVYSSSYKTASCTTQAVLQKSFTGTTTYTIPAGYSKMDVFCVGGGGAGGGYYDNAYGYSACGGGGGYTKTQTGIAVTAGNTCSITVGTGGSASAQSSNSSNRNLGCDGNPSSLKYGSTTVTAAGGYGGNSGLKESIDEDTSSNGGSGGGCACYSAGPSVASYIPRNGTAGGTNGRDGVTYRYTSSSDKTYYRYAGAGQGSTTRPFGGSTGTIYSGGGGGCSGSGNGTYMATVAGAGGEYGGGKGALVSIYNGGVYSNNAAVAGTANSGGGGGGGCYAYAEDGEGDITTKRMQTGKAGGSGIVIIKLYV